MIRFPGRLSENLAKENEAKLREWMKTKDLTPAEIKPNDPDSNNVESASYDPPFPACHAGFLAAGPRDHVLRIAVAMTEGTLHRKLGVEIVC